MIGQTNTTSNFMDEIDCGSFFEHIDDLLEFPSDDVDATLPDCTTTNNHTSCFMNNDDNSFPGIWSTQSDSLPGSASDLSAELSVPVSAFNYIYTRQFCMIWCFVFFVICSMLAVVFSRCWCHRLPACQFVLEF
jgi:hypothetical protein